MFMFFILIVPGAANRGAGSVLFVYFNDFYTLYSISAAKYRKVVRVCKEGVIFRTTAQQNNARAVLLLRLRPKCGQGIDRGKIRI